MRIAGRSSYLSDGRFVAKGQAVSRAMVNRHRPGLSFWPGTLQACTGDSRPAASTAEDTGAGHMTEPRETTVS